MLITINFVSIYVMNSAYLKPILTNTKGNLPDKDMLRKDHKDLWDRCRARIRWDNWGVTGTVELLLVNRTGYSTVDMDYKVVLDILYTCYHRPFYFGTTFTTRIWKFGRNNFEICMWKMFV